MSEIQEKEFELFFQNKSNVTMSSYKVDPKTNLLIQSTLSTANFNITKNTL